MATCALVLALCAATRAQAQAVDTLEARTLAPGVTYRRFIDRSGPSVVYLVRVELRRSDIELRHLRAHDRLGSRERASEMVKRATEPGATVLAAINADFFNLQTGENENNQVLDGEWWKGVRNTDSPYDTFDNAHVQFGLDARGRPVMDRYQFDGIAWSRGAATPIITLNFATFENPEGTVLYSSRYGSHTPRDTTRQVVEAPMLPAGRRGDTLLYVRRGAVATASGSAIPAGGAVLVAYGPGARQTEVKAMADGDTVRLLLATRPRLKSSPTPRLLIGGWPRLLRDGVDVSADAPAEEGTLSRNAEVRHPRSAIGFSRDSSTLFLVAVDGRQEASAGMTLTELAAMLRRLGAWNAMNFDGGGSTTMVIGGAVVNRPSDQTGERAVGNVLAVVRKGN